MSKAAAKKAPAKPRAKAKAPPKRPVGRPTKYKPEFCQTVVELAREGNSLTALAVQLGVTRQTLYEWQEVYPDFSDACTRAREAAMLWWDGVAKKQALGLTEGGSTGALMFMMKNQFPDDYRDRKEVKHDGDLKLVTVDFLGYVDEDGDD